MPNNRIVIIDADIFSNRDLVQPLVQSYVQGTQQQKLYNPISLSSSDKSQSRYCGSIVDYPPPFASPFSQQFSPVSKKQFEIQEVGKASPAKEVTESASAVIYVISHIRDKQYVDDFVREAKQKVLIVRVGDVSDTHAKKYLVLVANDRALDDYHTEAFHALQSFAQTEGFELKQVSTVKEESTKTVDGFFNELLAETATPNLFSRIVGATLYGLLGGLTHALLINPLARFYIACKHTYWGRQIGYDNKKELWGDVAQRWLFNLIRIAFSPFVGVFYKDPKAILDKFKIGWQRGALVGLESPYYVGRIYLRYYSTPIIASLIVIGLVTGAILLTLGVFGSAVVAGVGLSALAIQGLVYGLGWMGFSGLSITALAVIAGVSVLIGGTVLYGVSRFITYLATFPPNPVSRFFGAIVSAVLSGLTSLVLINPISLYYICWQNFNTNHLFRSLIRIFPVTPIIGSIGIAVIEVFTGLLSGWKYGLVYGVKSPYEQGIFMLRSQSQKLSNTRNIIVGAVVAGLVTAAVLLTAGLLGPVIVGGVSLTALAVQGAATLAGVFGLTGLGTAALAAIAGTTVWLASSLFYGAVYGTFKLIKYCLAAQPAANSVSSDNKDSEITVPLELAAQMNASSYSSTRAPGYTQASGPLSFSSFSGVGGEPPQWRPAEVVEDDGAQEEATSSDQPLMVSGSCASFVPMQPSSNAYQQLSTLPPAASAASDRTSDPLNPNRADSHGTSFLQPRLVSTTPAGIDVKPVVGVGPAHLTSDPLSTAAPSVSHPQPATSPSTGVPHSTRPRDAVGVGTLFHAMNDYGVTADEYMDVHAAGQAPSGIQGPFYR